MSAAKMILAGVLVSGATLFAGPAAAQPAGKIVICHVPPGNPGNAHTIEVSENAWPAHERHGDYRGECDTSANSVNAAAGAAGGTRVGAAGGSAAALGAGGVAGGASGAAVGPDGLPVAGVEDLPGGSLGLALMTLGALMAGSSLLLMRRRSAGARS